MAVSDSFDTTNQMIKYRITVTEGTPNIPENKSPVTVKVDVWRTNTGYTTYGSGTCKCAINGTWYEQSIGPDQEFTYNSHTEVFSRTVDIEHDTDGSKTIWVSAYISHQRFSSNDQGFSVPLSTIPRASSFASGTSDSGTFGTAITINISPSSNTFRHKITFTFGTKSETSSYIAAGTTQYKPTYSATTYGTEIPNSMSGSGSLVLITYNGDTEIGRVSQNITMSLPSYTPTCNTPTLAEQTSKVKEIGTTQQIRWLCTK